MIPETWYFRVMNSNIFDLFRFVSFKGHGKIVVIKDVTYLNMMIWVNLSVCYRADFPLFGYRRFTLSMVGDLKCCFFTRRDLKKNLKICTTIISLSECHPNHRKLHDKPLQVLLICYPHLETAAPVSKLLSTPILESVSGSSINQDERQLHNHCSWNQQEQHDSCLRDPCHTNSIFRHPIQQPICSR